MLGFTSSQSLKAPKISLSDQLSDLSVERDAIQQQYKTLILENEEYKQHIAELQHQNEDLKHALSVYEEQKQFKPMLIGHLSMMETSLNMNEHQIQKLKNKLFDYSQTIKSLKSENITIKQQNEKFRIALENINKQKQVLKQIQNDTSRAKDKQIHSLQDEIRSLRDEIHTLKTIRVKSVMDNDPNISILPDSNPIIDFQKTIEMQSGAEWILPSANSMFTAAPDSSDSVAHCFHNRRDTRFSLTVESIDEIEYDEIDPLDESDGQYKFIDDDDDDNDDNDVTEESDFDDNEHDEMEQLFQKCDGEILGQKLKDREILRKYGDNLIEKYRWLWFELQLRHNNWKHALKHNDDTNS